MIYDYSKLLGKIKEKCGTQINFACLLGLSERSLSLKLSGKRQWTQKEIGKICKILDIKTTDIPVYFFTLKVQY